MKVCSDCHVPLGGQHRPSCHRQGVVTAASDYTAARAASEADAGDEEMGITDYGWSKRAEKRVERPIVGDSDCICLGDGLMGMPCTAIHHSRYAERDAPEKAGAK